MYLYNVYVCVLMCVNVFLCMCFCVYVLVHYLINAKYVMLNKSSGTRIGLVTKRFLVNHFYNFIISFGFCVCVYSVSQTLYLEDKLHT